MSDIFMRGDPYNTDRLLYIVNKQQQYYGANEEFISLEQYNSDAMPVRLIKTDYGYDVFAEKYFSSLNVKYVYPGVWYGNYMFIAQNTSLYPLAVWLNGTCTLAPKLDSGILWYKSWLKSNNCAVSSRRVNVDVNNCYFSGKDECKQGYLYPLCTDTQDCGLCMNDGCKYNYGKGLPLSYNPVSMSKSTFPRWAWLLLLVLITIAFIIALYQAKYIEGLFMAVTGYSVLLSLATKTS